MYVLITHKYFQIQRGCLVYKKWTDWLV